MKKFVFHCFDTMEKWGSARQGLFYHFLIKFNSEKGLFDVINS